MKRTDQEHLLNEILTGDDNSNFRHASLERALQKNHQRQRNQTLLRFGAMVIVVGLVAWKFALPQHKTVTKIQPVQMVKTETVVTAVNKSKVKIITDDELLALFPNRPVALIGKPGHQRLIFLDEPNTHAGGSL